MLTPEYLDQLPDSVIALYQQAEMDILKDMARRILSVGEMTSTAEYQMRRLEAMGASREYIMQMLSSLTRKTRQELQHMMIKAGAKTLAEDDEIYRAAGMDPKPVSQSPQMQRIIRAGLKNTMGLFRNLTRTTAKAGQEQLIRAMDRAWMQIVSGGFDYRRAVENAIKSVAASGLSSVQYPSGHSDSLDVAVRRAVLTGVNQTGLKMQDARMDEMDCRFVEVSAHGGARNKGSGPANHESWQGKVYCRKGKSKEYPDFYRVTGYGTGEGLGGWNCRHHYHAFYPGISKRVYSDQDLKDLDQKTVVYNGKQMSVYEATQKQREIERHIRKWKREAAMMEAAGLDPSFANSKVREWQAKQRDFIAQTGLVRQYDREKVVAGSGEGMTAPFEIRMSMDDSSLTDQDRGALNRYISSESYRINAKLRAQENLSEKDHELIRSIDSAIMKLPQYKGKVYRSLSSEYMENWADFDERHRPGNIIRYDAYTSTSKNIYDETMDIQMIIKSKRGYDFVGINDKEKEVLFKRGTMFLVTKREGNTIWMEEI